MLKRLFACCAALLFCATATTVGAATEETALPSLSAGAACLMDAESGQVLVEKNMDAQLPPASITKIMTTLLAVENSSWDDIVTMSETAVFSVPRDASHIALSPGETLTMEQALMATMLPSANDAANGVAETVGGTIEEFVRMMNDRAAEIGATNTHFVNANGLDDPAHLTTARDMALITREAIQNEDFLRVFSATEYEIPPTNLQPESRAIGAGNKLVFDFTSYYDPDVIGAKSGYTTEAKHTLVSVAQRDGRTLICVVLAEPSNNTMYQDTIALLNYGFSAFSEITITPQELALKVDASEVQLTSTEPVKLLLAGGMDAKDITTRYHVEQGDQYSVTVKVDFSLPEDTGTQYVQLGSTRLEYVLPLASTGASAESATEKQSGPDTMTVVLWSLAIVAGAALALFILLLLYVRLRYDLRRAVRSWKRRNAVKKSLYLSIPGPDVQPVEQIPQKTKTDSGTASRQPKSKRYQ